ncbi:MAG TPA: SCP2 sterol-binding domain-containing protein [Mycobacteriales bacterium]|jgi:hypothetical protein|nr:SCP2 sterol-binding domain-containing protein [Mycobacteriales bacterium]
MELPDELAGLTPEEVLAFLREAGDDEIRDRVHGIGTATVLGLVFDGWAARVTATGLAPGLLLFALDDDGREHRHALELGPTGAQHRAEPGDPPRATLRTTLVRFLRVAAGAQDPKRLVLTGRLRLGGDVVWAVTSLAGLQR